ncbi:toxin-antitoxin system HicB family antitoxin [Crossiella sp. CA198]|uniref:toxin-antitoxin system HicB family antitoxin n=1 Tax=Crossiella sp. CA198 TaxID=3455607 RepID=UPI003F8D2832
MDLTSYVNGLREDLTTAASAGDEQTRRTAALLAAALEPAARLAIMNALSDLAAEVTATLDGQLVDVRLDGRDVRVVVTPAAGQRRSPAADSVPPPPPPPPPFSPLGEGGDISRITLRLFEELKGKAEKAANAQGVSLNSWLSQAVQGALHGQGTDDRSRRHEWRQQRRSEQRGEATNSRLRGWVQG